MTTEKRMSEQLDLSAWMKEAMEEISNDAHEVRSGRPGSLTAYSVDELLKELHS